MCPHWATLWSTGQATPPGAGEAKQPRLLPLAGSPCLPVTPPAAFMDGPLPWYISYIYASAPAVLHHHARSSFLAPLLRSGTDLGLTDAAVCHGGPSPCGLPLNAPMQASAAGPPSRQWAGNAAPLRSGDCPRLPALLEALWLPELHRLLPTRGSLCQAYVQAHFQGGWPTLSADP